MGSANFKEMQRVYYYDGLFLTADLCITDQRFVRDMMLYHNQALFSSGTACGLNVTASSTGNSVMVSAGMAIDGNGNQLIWPEDLASTPTQIPSDLSNGSLYIYIQYNVINPSDNGGQPNLIIECPTIKFAQNIAQITDQNLILAEATIDNKIIQADSLKDARVGVALNVPVNSAIQISNANDESLANKNSFSTNSNTITTPSLQFSIPKLDAKYWPTIVAEGSQSENYIQLKSDVVTINNKLLVKDRLGIATEDPVATLDVAGTFRVNGNTFSKLLAGTEIIQPNSDPNIKIIKVTFAYSKDNNKVFSTPPKINATVCSADDEDAVFALTLSAIKEDSFTVSVMRIDSIEGTYTWKQPLTIEWFAYQTD